MDNQQLSLKRKVQRLVDKRTFRYNDTKRKRADLDFKQIFTFVKYKRKVNNIPTKEYSAWKAMKARCYAPCNKDMGKYQKNNIQVCKRWIHSYENFIDDMGLAPSKKHTLDRIDTNKNYSPNNCRWATQEEQCNNRGEFNLTYTYNGEIHTLKEWSKILNINYSTLYLRIKRSKLTFEDAIKNDPFNRKKEINGTKLSIIDWCKKYNQKYQLVIDRLHRGWNLEDALIRPKSK